MRINANFAVAIDIIEFEPFLGEDIKVYQKAFEAWYYELVTMNGIQVYRQRSDLPFKHFNGEVIVAWMNEVAPGCNARIVEYDIPTDKEDTTLPSMYF